jgi:thiamine-monophosphate kinase
MDEFELIEHFFASMGPTRNDVLLGIGDDAALLRVPHGKLLVDSTDTLVEGVHFGKNTPPHAIGYKSLAVNLSDLAAMGATPCWASLSITLPSINESWLGEFAKGFSKLLETFNLQLIGGDTTCGPLSITVHLLGVVDPLKTLRRDTAKTDDIIYVTGTLGDAASALHELQIGHIPDETLLNRLYYPMPRIQAGNALGGIANAAIDISDGLLADLNHILIRSHLGAVIFPEKLPLSEKMRQNNTIEAAIEYALCGGDDYELCITVAPHSKKALEVSLETIKCPYTCVGVLKAAPGLYLQTSNDQQLINNPRGYVHF